MQLSGANDETGPLPSGFRGHFLGVACGWGLLCLASPGVLCADGSTALALAGVTLWAAFASRPPRGRERSLFLAEWLGGALGLGGLMWWVAYVAPVGVLAIGIVQGLYMTTSGLLLRRLAPHIPLALAVPLAWCTAEALRAWFPPPIGLAWLRLGQYAHHHLWFSTSAAYWGTEGLGFVLAALAGGFLDFARGRSVVALLLGFLPLGAAAGLSAWRGAVPVAAGPRLLLVQPGFSQERKMKYDPLENFQLSRELTHDGLEQNSGRAAAEIDLVCWGESMLFLSLFEDEVLAALEGGERPQPWSGADFDLDTARFFRGVERQWIGEGLFGNGSGARLLPEGTSFLAGADMYALVEGEIRRRNSVVLYDPSGARVGQASKRFLVPGAESLFGLERWGWAREIALRLVGYLPVIVPAEETGTLEFSTRAGERYRFSATICFDNAFPRAYTEPTRATQLDFHLIASNEAWYRDSCEMDQMIAFSRLIALSTGLSVVRATNSGVSLVLGPDGREVARVQSGDQDRHVPGTLAVDVPVPPRGSPPGPTPYARTRGLWGGLWVLLSMLALVRFRARAVPGGNLGPDPG